MRCPRCDAPLRPVRTRTLRSFRCPQGHGEAVSLPVLRRVASRARFGELLAAIRAKPPGGGVRCPTCERPSAAVQLVGGPELDACKSCQMVWLDPGEGAAIAARKTPAEEREEPAPKPLPPEAIRLLATARAEQVRARAALDADDYDVAAGWQDAATWLGFPAELDAPTRRSGPYVTWTIAILVALVTFLLGTDSPMIPDAYSMGWAGWINVGVILYFLLLFGDNVEDDLGVGGYLALLTAAAGIGVGLGRAADAPAMTALGTVVSATAGYYAARFPRARLGFRWYVWWHGESYWFSFRAAVAVVLLLLGLIPLALSWAPEVPGAVSAAYLAATLLGAVVARVGRQARLG